ncbi:calmodulin-like [Haliotis cracherodii]|uniref:calmodulin-like n=1 Tax=Haliotis cracherodii TaxID=6455 RepID=UPI0039EC1FDF
MIAFLVLIGIVAVYGQDPTDGHHHHHSCIHNNQQQLKATQVITSVIADMEKDGDGIVEQTEVKTEFLTKYDKDMSGDVSEDEFVKQWHQRYHDEHDFAGYLFHHFDANDDLKLTDSDVVALEKGLDTDGDGRVSVAEFQTYLTNLYTNCVPSHGN